MRANRYISFLLGLGLLGLPTVALAAGSASAGESWVIDTRLNSKSTPRLQRYGREISFTARLRADSPNSDEWIPLRSQPLLLQRKAKKKAKFETIATGFTDFEGRIKLTQVASRSYTYRILYAGATFGSVTLEPVRSMSWGSKVRRLMNEQVANKNGRVFYKGRVEPTYAKRKIVIQRKTCKHCDWKQYSQQRTTKGSEYQFRTPAPRTGIYYYRVRTGGSNGFVKTTGRTLQVYINPYGRTAVQAKFEPWS